MLDATALYKTPHGYRAMISTYDALGEVAKANQLRAELAAAASVAAAQPDTGAR